MMLALLLTGCGDNTFTGSEDAHAPDSKPQAGIVRLTTEEIQSGEIIVHSVTSGDFRIYREFPATVAPNHHATAQITALVGDASSMCTPILAGSESRRCAGHAV